MGISNDKETNICTIIPKARQGVHECVLGWFRRQLRYEGKILDAPAGYGHLSMKLKEMGFDVTCGEINPEIFRVKELKCIYTDLNRKIDAPDNYFDYVCCIDGLEHMTDPYTATTEFARVLKVGGIGVFSIPNYSNIEKRFAYLIRGYLAKPKTKKDFEDNDKKLFDIHNSPLTITLLDFIFSINNLEISEILKEGTKTKQYFLLPFAWLLKFIAALTPKKSREKHRTAVTLNNDILLGGNNAIFIVRKNYSDESRAVAN